MKANPRSATANIEFLKSVDSPTLENAIETLHVQPRAKGFTPLQIRCLFPELGRLCGYAVTAQVESVTQLLVPKTGHDDWPTLCVTVVARWVVTLTPAILSLSSGD